MYATLPEPARSAVAGAVAKIALAAAGGPFRQLRTRIRGSRDDQARRLALGTAVTAALQDRSDLDAIGLVAALRRKPFADLITRVLRNPHDEVNRVEVERAFASSVYDLNRIGIDEVVLVEEVRVRFLDALRTGPTLEAKQLFVSARAEQIHAGQMRLEAGQERIAADLRSLAAEPASVAAQDEIGEEGPWKARIEEARALHQAGAVRSALRLWERLREEMMSASVDPMLRARVHNNAGAASVELNELDQAIRAFRQALEYAPGRADFLANLAQAELLADRRADALRDAERAIGLDPESTVGWAVRIQAMDHPLPEEEIPVGLRGNAQILTARAMSEVDRDHATAIRFLREALRIGPRDPQLLILLAELLYSSMFPHGLSEPVPEQPVEEIARLAHEAAAVLEGTERFRLHARALVIQGAAADLGREEDRGAAFFQRAVEVDPTYERARFGAAQARILRGDGGTALFFLDGVPADDRSASWHALRARALFTAGRSSELDSDVAAALEEVEAGESDSVAQSLAETVLKAERLDLLNSVLALVARCGQQDFLHIFRARAAA